MWFKQYIQTSLVSFTFCHSLVSFSWLSLRLDELRHRLIPLYSYDPAEEQDSGEADGEDEEEELTVSTLLVAYNLLPFSIIYIVCNVEFNLSRTCFSLQEPLYKEGNVSFSSDYRR